MPSKKRLFRALKFFLAAVIGAHLPTAFAQQCNDAARPMCGPYGTPLTFEDFGATCKDESNQFWE